MRARLPPGRGRLLLLCAALAVAYAAPRIYAYRGVEVATALDFMDMEQHQLNLDLLEKRMRLEPSSWNDPLLDTDQALGQLRNPVKWPHGAYWAALPWAHQWGLGSIWTVQLTNLFFSVLMVVGLVGLGWRAGVPWAGWWAALLSLLFPPLVAGTCYLNLDYPLAAVVVFGLFVLSLTNHFSRAIPTLVFGIWSGVALWVKLTYVLYLVIPCVAALVIGLARTEKPRLRRGGRAVALSLMGAALAFLIAWALVRFPYSELLEAFTTHLSAAFPEQGDGAQQVIQPFTARWLLAIPLMIFNEGSWLLGLLLSAGLLLAHTSRGRTPLRWLLLSALWGGVLLLTLMGNKMGRYLLPLYPALLLLATMGLGAVIPERWRRAALAGLGVTFSLILVLTHLAPDRWLMDEQSRTEDRYMYDLLLPSRAQLGGLRSFRYHHRCQVEGLVAGAHELMRLAPTEAPVSTYKVEHEGTGVIYDHQAVDNAFSALELYMLQENPHRVVMTWVHHLEMAQRSGLLLLLYHADTRPPPALMKSREVMAQRRVTVTCGHRPAFDIMLSLSRLN